MPSTTQKKVAWEKQCECGFFLRDHNEKEFINLVQVHVKTTHGQNIDAPAVLASSKRIG